MSSVSRALYKPLSIAMGVAGGLVASSIFDQVWKRVSNSPETPEPEDLTRSGGEVLLAAALQGVVFSLVRAGVMRISAHGYRAVTHENLD